MYIRRKVFSILTDEMGEERLYSVNETVFEGYEVREFAEKEEKKSHKGAKIAAGVAGTVGATAAGVYAAKKGLLGAKAAEKVNKVVMKYTKAGGKHYEQAVKDATKAQSRRLNKEAAAAVEKDLPMLDKISKGNISRSKAESLMEKYAKELKKAVPGMK